MVRYLETFFRNRLLLLAPVILALLATLGFAMSQPRMYQASAKLWFDGSVSPVDYLNASTPYTAPASLQQSVLLELLQTRTFAHQVGTAGPLAAYLAATPDAYSNRLSPSVLLAGLFPPSSPSSEMDSVLVDTLSKHAAVSLVGPQVLNVTFDAPDPQVAASTTQALVDALFAQIKATQLVPAQAAVDFYRQQIAQQPTPKPGDDAAKTLLANLQDKLDQAELHLAAVKLPGTGGYRVIDAPIIPMHPKSLRRQLAFAGGAGLAIGTSIALFLLLMLTWSDRTLRAPQDAQAMLGRKVVGTIPLDRGR